jgi:adenosylmethionine-8-amino-7-oxononanoate aminotransferase
LFARSLRYALFSTGRWFACQDDVAPALVTLGNGLAGGTVPLSAVGVKGSPFDFENGIITYKSTGLAGIDGDAILVAPPLVMQSGDLEIVADRLKSAIERVLS